MARRRGRQAASSPRGRQKAPPDYYASSESDQTYLQVSRQRVTQKGRRRWLIRLAVLAVLALAAYVWGPTLVHLAKGESAQTVKEFQGMGRHIRSGVERRSGAGLDDTEP